MLGGERLNEKTEMFDTITEKWSRKLNRFSIRVGARCFPNRFRSISVSGGNRCRHVWSTKKSGCWRVEIELLRGEKLVRFLRYWINLALEKLNKTLDKKQSKCNKINEKQNFTKQTQTKPKFRRQKTQENSIKIITKCAKHAFKVLRQIYNSKSTQNELNAVKVFRQNCYEPRKPSKQNSAELTKHSSFAHIIVAAVKIELALVIYFSPEASCFHHDVFFTTNRKTTRRRIPDIDELTFGM